MDKERLQYIIKNPQSINDDDIEMLSSIVAMYPYFTIAQVLLAVGFDLKEDKRLNKQLRLAAAMSSDRNSLRHLLAESKEKKQTCDLPDEFGNDGQQTADNRLQTLESVVIPEIDLSKSHEELSKEMALLEEKRKSLDELRDLIEQRIIELEREKEESNKEEKTLSKTEIIDKLIELAMENFVQ